MIKVSQEDIILLLEKVKKPLSRKEISDILNERPEKVSLKIKDLIKYGEIEFKEISRIEAKKLYGDKAPFRRMRIYFVKC